MRSGAIFQNSAPGGAVSTFFVWKQYPSVGGVPKQYP